jgi:hypothetical protein
VREAVRKAGPRVASFSGRFHPGRGAARVNAP